MGLAVCAAGFRTAGPFLDGDLENELNLLQWNCGATTALSWHFGKRLAPSGQGGLILLLRRLLELSLAMPPLAQAVLAAKWLYQQPP